MIFKTNTIVLLMGIILMSSCSFLSPVKIEPNTIYVLNSSPDVAIRANKRPISLLVTPPLSNSIFNTTEMAYTIKPHQIGYFAKNRWAENPSQMIYQLLIQTLQKTHYFRQVGSSATLNKYAYILNTQLIVLEQDYITKPYMLHLKMRAQLFKANDNEMIASKEFMIDEPISEIGPYGGVVAANQAVNFFLRQIAEFSIRTLENQDDEK